MSDQLRRSTLNIRQADPKSKLAFPPKTTKMLHDPTGTQANTPNVTPHTVGVVEENEKDVNPAEEEATGELVHQPQKKVDLRRTSQSTAHRKSLRRLRLPRYSDFLVPA